MNSTGSIIAGSYMIEVLFERTAVRRANCQPNDIDIFGYNLDFLKLLIKFILESGRETICGTNWTRRSKLDSYKIVLKNDSHRHLTINFVHLKHPDLEITSPENNHELTKAHILREFDISACLTMYYNNELHYNSKTLSKMAFVRRTHHYRVYKYQCKGFKLIPIPGSYLSELVLGGRTLYNKE